MIVVLVVLSTVLEIVALQSAKIAVFTPPRPHCHLTAMHALTSANLAQFLHH